MSVTSAIGYTLSNMIVAAQYGPIIHWWALLLVAVLKVCGWCILHDCIEWLRAVQTIRQHVVRLGAR